MQGQFELPFEFQVAAVFLLAITGAILAIEKKYDIAGVFTLAFIAGASGAIIRDGVFLSQIPVMLEKWQYLVAVVAGAVITLIFINYIKKINTVFVVIDALGLGLFGIISAQMAVNSGLNIVAAIFVGLIGAVSGGFLRDILTKNNPLLLQPGQYYITAALVGISLFLVLSMYAGINAQIAAIVGIVLAFVIRMLSYAFNWQSFPAVNVSEKLFKKTNQRKED